MPARGTLPCSADGWAILGEPPGHRDLAEPAYWHASTERSRRRRDVAHDDPRDAERPRRDGRRDHRTADARGTAELRGGAWPHRRRATGRGGAAGARRDPGLDRLDGNLDAGAAAGDLDAEPALE